MLEALLERDPSDQEARQQLGQVYLAEGRYDEAFEQLLPVVDKLVERRQVDRAAALLQQIVQRNPAHVRSLAKLVELYRLSRNDAAGRPDLLADGRGLPRARAGMDQAASILEMLVQLEPHNEQHRTKLKWLREQQERGGGFERRPRVSPRLAPASAVAAARGRAPRAARRSS